MMQKIRLRQGVIDQIKADRNLVSDFQVAAILGVTLDELEAMRNGATISPIMAAHVAVIQGTQFDLSQWVEYAASARQHRPAA